MAADGVALGALAAGLGVTIPDGADTPITDVTHDSRLAGPGTLFVALRGQRSDGHAFVEAAIAAGSPAVCVDAAADAAWSVPALVVDDTRRALAVLADAVHGHPSGSLRLVGVTGTNGKTTVTHMVDAIGRAAGLTTACAGTVGGHIAGTPIEMTRTTPEASDLQRLLAAMVSAGVALAAIEASSHGLALHRTDGTEFAVAAFTNLSQDHLDFHGDMEAYYAAKRRLFDQAARAVISVSDPAGVRLADEVTIPTLTVGAPDADITGTVTEAGFDGTTIAVTVDGQQHELRVPLAGGFNAANGLVAAGIAHVLGIPWDTIAEGMASVDAIPGRFELIDIGKGFTVVVDYAHTPNGVAEVITAAREIVAGTGKVIAVVGAGGDRDRDKRPLMGQAAAMADLAVLTSDNPRNEDPITILDEVARGVPEASPAVIEPDRRLAISRAIAEAGPGDVVLVLGKGHESGQDIGGVVVPFDDRLVVREEAAL